MEGTSGAAATAFSTVSTARAGQPSAGAAGAMTA